MSNRSCNTLSISYGLKTPPSTADSLRVSAGYNSTTSISHELQAPPSIADSLRVSAGDGGGGSSSSYRVPISESPYRYGSRSDRICFTDRHDNRDDKVYVTTNGARVCFTDCHGNSDDEVHVTTNGARVISYKRAS